MRLIIWLSDLLYDALALVRNLWSTLRRRGSVYVLLELAGGYPEHRPPAAWWVRRRPESVEEVRRRLRVLAADPSVAGVVVTASGLDAGLATIQSLRSALARFRDSGKRVIAYLPQASTRLYYLASVADTVVMPESGTLNLVGLTLEATFLGEALGRAGVAAEFEQIAEYKSAAEPFVRGSMSAPMREALNAILDSVYDDVVRDIAAARRLDPVAIQRVVNRAPLSASAARDAGLVDAVLFEDELPGYLAVGARRPEIAPWVLARRRLRRPLRWRSPGRAIAVITVRGAIHMGESRARPPVPLPLPFVSEDTAGHATIARAIRAAERNPGFGAIVLSVESPGGSALASDLIWREVRRADRTKPVVAFLGNVAGSGGYYVAAAARQIVCLPGTLTGSIGVISGKFSVRELVGRAGVHREILARGETATIFSLFVPFSAEERRRLHAQAEETYDRFVSRVAEGRRLPRETVLAAAKGRVWTGRQAQCHGLVDELGDFTAAVDAAKRLMGIARSRAVRVVHVRPPRGLALPNSSASEALSALAPALGALLEERILAVMPYQVSVR